MHIAWGQPTGRCAYLKFSLINYLLAIYDCILYCAAFIYRISVSVYNIQKLKTDKKTLNGSIIVNQQYFEL